MKLALFDLDHTLLQADSDHGWGEFLIRHQLVDAERHKRMNDQFYEDYKAGCLDAVAYNEFVFEFLAQHDRVELAALHEQFMEETIRPVMRPKGREAIEWHRQQGHAVAVITATNRFITEPIALAFGVPDLMASEPEIFEGRYTGKLCGEPCIKEAKIRHLQHWLAGRTLEESWAYSDSINDLALLEFVDHPVVVNPDTRLHAAALDRHWPVVDWSF